MLMRWISHEEKVRAVQWQRQRLHRDGGFIAADDLLLNVDSSNINFIHLHFISDQEQINSIITRYFLFLQSFKYHTRIYHNYSQHVVINYTALLYYRVIK